MIGAGLWIIYVLSRLTKALPFPLVATLVLSGISILTNAPGVEPS